MPASRFRIDNAGICHYKSTIDHNETTGWTSEGRANSDAYLANCAPECQRIAAGTGSRAKLKDMGPKHGDAHSASKGALLVDPPSSHPPITNYPSLLYDPSCPLTPPHPPPILTLCPYSTPALKSYKRKTKKDLTSHPLLPRLESCDSPEAILIVLREQIPAFDQSQNGDDRLTKWVSPTVNALYALSATVGQGVGLAFPPANAIFAGIGVLLLVRILHAQETIIVVFNRIEHFFRRLEIYTALTPTAAMTDIIVQIMVEVLTILGIATKEVKRGPLKKYLKKLAGNRDIEDSLERLDKLTQEEARMASAGGVEGKMQDVRDDVQDVRGDVRDVGDKVQDVDDRVQLVQDIGKDISIGVQGVDDKLDQANRNQLRDNLLQWLSPRDPSTNHNIASKAHHNGTLNGSFEAVYSVDGNQPAPSCGYTESRGPGKVSSDIMALRDAGRASMAYFYFDFRDVDKQKLTTCFPLCSSNFLPALIPVVTYSPTLFDPRSWVSTEPSDREMVGCLKEMLSLEAQPPIYIILDALDECPVTTTIPPSPREEVLEFVDELVGLHLPNLHICVTSRPEHDIRVVLEGLTEHPVSLHDERGCRDGGMKDKNLVIKILSEKVDGMFRWAYCQLEVLRHVFPSSVPRILEELPDSLDEDGHAHRLLQCLVAAVRPLRVKELAEVLAFDFNAEGIPKLNQDWRWEDQEEAVMSACSSFADRLVESMRDVSRYHIRLEAAHTILVRAASGFSSTGRSPRRDSMKSFQLARIKDGMECLFDADKPHFATWLWIYNEDQWGGSRPPLYYVAMLGFRDLAEHLIAEHPQHVTVRGGREVTPLHVAASAGHSDILSLLIEHGADMNGRGRYGDIDGQSDNKNTAIIYATFHGHAEFARMLLERGQ
ncbi:hypothetical protein F5888DRAFT_1835168 [Russula emetica]|nr:hypothetical protein F5888DRAFT_1835168 [Russula emetica]